MKLIKAAFLSVAIAALLVEFVPLARASLQSKKQYAIIQANSANIMTEPAITVDDIQALNRDIEVIIAQGDVEGILQYMAPFIISETITESSVGTESVYIEGIEDHRRMLTRVFNEAETEELSDTQEISKQETIRVTSDGQLATAVISTVNEVTTDNEFRLVSTIDTIRFARLQGEIKVIFYTTDSRITSHDLQN